MDENVIRTIDAEDLRGYLSYYQGINNCNSTTIDGVRRTLSSFFTFLEEEEYIVKSPNKFRRTLATRAIDKGMPIEQVQHLLGHTKIDTTLLYAMVNQNNVKISHRKYIC